MIPGSNLLKMALKVIGSQTVQYIQYLGRVENSAGFLVSTYAEPVPLTGSFQPVPRQYFAQMGLDYNKSYAMLYDPNGTIKDLDRDRSGDYIEFADARYEAMSSTDWTPIDGWNGTLFVKLLPNILPLTED